MTAQRPRRPWDRVPAEAREYFDLLGEGLVAHVSGRAEGTNPKGGWSPASGGAWVHISESGRVRAFTGKVEVGQGTRTALALVVAEELRLPLEQVEMVMGDTDLSPWDMGTFGSRSMPDAAPTLRTAASGAREALLDLAVTRGLGERASLKLSRGHVRGPSEGKAASYGELVRGLRRIVTVDPCTPSTPAEDWKVAGHPASDPTAVEVVTGRRQFVSDLLLPGMLYGAVLLPPRYGSRLRNVDTAPIEHDPRLRVVKEGKFVGVVAPTPREAHLALARVEAHWSGDPQPTEQEIEAYLRSHPQSGDDWDTDLDRAGDPKGALRHASARVEATYRTAYIAHVPLETRSALAEWDGPRVTIWLGSQTPFRAREYVARELGMGVEDVRVIIPYTGAGFGGKHGGDVAAAAARLARGAKGLVKLTFSREEEFQYGYLRPMAIIDVKAGADPDGRLRGWVFHDVNAGAAALRTPYRVEDRQVDNELSASPLPQGPYRSLAANANNFARESAIDELAALLHLDPFTMRERNLDDERLLTVLRRGAEAAQWTLWKREEGKGHGLAIGNEKGGRVATVAEVTVDADRAVHIDRLLTVFEAGAIVHPENLRSQVEGATVMAMGGAIFEAVHFDRGRILNPRLSEYRVPRFSDLPRIEALLIDRPDLPSAGGGETPMIAVAPAIANALFDASGVRLRSLPLLTDGRFLPSGSRDDLRSALPRDEHPRARARVRR